MKFNTPAIAAKYFFAFVLICFITHTRAQEAQILNPPNYLGYDSNYVVLIKVRNTLPLTQMTSVSFDQTGGAYDNTVDSIVLINDSVFSAKIHTGYTIQRGNQFLDLYFGNDKIRVNNAILLYGTQLQLFGTPTRGYSKFITFSASPISAYSLEQDQFTWANCQTPDGMVTPNIQIDSVDVLAGSDFRARISVNDHLAFGWYKVVFMTKKNGKMVYYFEIKQPNIQPISILRGKPFTNLQVRDLNAASLFKKGQPNTVTWYKNNIQVSSIVCDSTIALYDYTLNLYGNVSANAEFGTYQMVIRNSIDTLTTSFIIQSPKIQVLRINNLQTNSLNRKDSSIVSIVTLAANLNQGTTTIVLKNAADSANIAISNIVTSTANFVTFLAQVKPNARAGKYYFYLTNSFDSIQLLDSFTVMKGYISMANPPAYFATETTTTVELKGSNTLFTQATPVFNYFLTTGGTAIVDSIVVISDTKMFIRVKIDPFGKGRLTNVFYSEVDDSIYLPSIAILSPRGSLGQNTYTIGQKDSIKVMVAGVHTLFHRVTHIKLSYAKYDSTWIDVSNIFTVYNTQITNDTILSFWIKTNTSIEPSNVPYYNVSLTDSVSGQMIPSGSVRLSKPFINQKPRLKFWKQASDTLWIGLGCFVEEQLPAIDSITFTRTNGLPLLSLRVSHFEFKKVGAINGILLYLTMDDTITAGDFYPNIFINAVPLSSSMSYLLTLQHAQLVSPKIGSLVKDSITSHFLAFQGLYESTATFKTGDGVSILSSSVSNDTIYFTIKANTVGVYGIYFKTPMEPNLFYQTVTVSVPTAIQTLNSTQSFSYYPNPVKDVLTLETSEQMETTSVSVYDLIGRKYELNLVPIYHGYQVNVAELPTGIYTAHIPFHSKTSTVKLVKE